VLIKLSKYGSADEDPEFLQKTKRKIIITYDIANFNFRL
jgi:hypothetical protein